jgi:hypothetical protein
VHNLSAIHSILVFFNSISKSLPPGRHAQSIASEPLATKTTASPLANLINFETLFFISPRFYERQAPSSDFILLHWWSLALKVLRA